METQHWIKQIDSTTHEVIQHFDGLSVEELNWKPNPKSWSIAQHIDHLMVINQTYYPIVKSVRDGTYKLPWIGKWRYMVDLFGRMIHKYVKPESMRKVETFKAALPSNNLIEVDVLKKFEQHQSELKTFIQSSVDLLDTDTVISSPANKNIVYTLKSAFDIIVSHECRHLEHAKNINALRKKIKPA